MVFVVTVSFVKKTPAAATAWPVEKTVLMCQEIVVMDLYVPCRDHAFSVMKKEGVVTLIHRTFAVLVIIALIMTVTR